MSNCNDIDTILRRNGTDQPQRFLADLDPQNLELHDFDIEDWILFTYNFAQHVNYFDVTDDAAAFDNWQDLFNYFELSGSSIPLRNSYKYKKIKASIKQTIAQYKTDGNLTPHLTLFICFLHLLEASKKRFNSLTKRHLDFYYNEVLKVKRNDPAPDQVHVIFELAKKSLEQQIVADTALNGNKDKQGNQMIYKTGEELIVNKTSVAALKSVYNDIDLKELKVSQVANTLDGFEEPLPEENPYWWPFAYTSKEQGFTALPDAMLGFALASPMFNLKEGLRTVQITIDFKSDASSDLSKFPAPKIIEIISLYGSGSEGWIELPPLAESITVTHKDNSEATYQTSSDKKDTLSLAFQLDKDIEGLSHYNPEILGDSYNTGFPVVRFVMDTKHEAAYDFYRALVNRIVTNISITVDVMDAKLLSIENDFGVLNPGKPFYPFTTQPIKGSNFFIDHAEPFSKAWDSLNINLLWKNTPDIGFDEWYGAYTNPPDDASYFKVTTWLMHKGVWQEDHDAQELFAVLKDPDTGDPAGYECNIKIDNSGDTYNGADTAGPVKLSLLNSFFHEQFSSTYARALISLANDITSDDKDIPNEPYTPLVESISLDYTAQESRTVVSQTLPIDETTPLEPENSLSAYNKNRLQLFHIQDFGMDEVHNHLNVVKQEKGIKDRYDTNTVNTHIFPKFCEGGSLFIGLKDARPLQSVSLLVQVLEGSENPLVETFKDNEAIDWAVLCDNKWKSLKDDILTNTTHNFLVSGIVKFNIPREATDTNTRFPKGYIWIRARMHKDYDAVCKVINIHAQAVQAAFENNGNELSQLENGLVSGTIKKLITRIPQIKSVSQPYNSFDGVPKESDAAFYRRISERLRHKNRAISLWDYEHLILQKFPDIYKAKCLNHTYDHHFLSAGHVTVVVIPDTVNKNVFDIYQPRVSQGLISKVKAYINSLNTMHVTADIVNPDYEEVKVILEVQFHEGYDASFYSKQMDQDIIKFLSPWAFDDAKKIAFGVELHKSVLIDYLEKLEYVDYLQNVRLEKDGQPVNNSVAPSSPRAILVSAKTHTISTDLENCKGEKPKTLEECPS
ncbi:baseplate J/gp47 family protein [Seonamhaeicola sp.]|uniref:baseplate J/gp47 family protein n=1 Tax=Seonamhaeicola sp. TaxID=1912245 RepID=UPI00260EF9BE|nr:baseplate J/gp47 family protein [Seonamhaeicola sp.]